MTEKQLNKSMITDDSRRYFSIQAVAQEIDYDTNVYRFKPCLCVTGWLTYVRSRAAPTQRSHEQGEKGLL